MTLLYLFIFAIKLFLLYHSYMLGLVRLELYACLGSYSVYPYVQWVNDKYCVCVVPICNIPDVTVTKIGSCHHEQCIA